MITDLLLARTRTQAGQSKADAEGRTCLTMESYLIMPVQRMPRYKLLLEELVCVTREVRQQLHVPGQCV